MKLILVVYSVLPFKRKPILAFRLVLSTLSRLLFPTARWRLLILIMSPSSALLLMNRVLRGNFSFRVSLIIGVRPASILLTSFLFPPVLALILVFMILLRTLPVSTVKVEAIILLVKMIMRPRRARLSSLTARVLPVTFITLKILTARSRQKPTVVMVVRFLVLKLLVMVFTSFHSGSSLLMRRLFFRWKILSPRFLRILTLIRLMFSLLTKRVTRARSWNLTLRRKSGL